MLSSQQRLRAEEVRGIISRGRSARAQFLSLKYTHSTSSDQATSLPALRAAVVISKKVAKDAVTRNRIRRQVYAALQGVAKTPINGVFFVNTLPPEPRLPLFIKDIQQLCSPRSS